VRTPGMTSLRGWTSLRTFAALASLLLAFAGPSFAAPVAKPDASGGNPTGGAVWRVVLMRGWDSLYPINITREKALRETLADGAPRLVEFFPEEIDPLRFPGAIEADIVALLQRKYVDTPVDLVIASGIESALKHFMRIGPDPSG